MNIITFRADATPRMGTGHVMRCMALAQAAKAHGMAVCLTGHVTVPWVLERLRQEDIAFTPLTGLPPAQETPERLLAQIAAIGSAQWLVLDGYHFGLDCHRAVREAGYKLLVIDDYAHVPEYSCDILLNQNIGAELFCYQGDIGKIVLGLEYALLRPEFAAAREKALQRVLPRSPKKILLTVGGGEFSTHLQYIASCLSVPEMQSRTLKVLAGSMSEKRIRHYLKDCPANIEILPFVANMADLLLDTDLCITAGGSTCWELCCMGVPFLVTEIAKNQRMIVQFLVNNKIANIVNPYNVSLCLTQKEMSFHNALTDICDGQGAQNILNLINI